MIFASFLVWHTPQHVEYVCSSFLCWLPMTAFCLPAPVSVLCINLSQTPFSFSWIRGFGGLWCTSLQYSNMQFSRNYTIKSLHFSRLTSMPSREAEILSKSTGSMEVTAMLMCLLCTWLFSSKMMTGLNNWSR